MIERPSQHALVKQTSFLLFAAECSRAEAERKGKIKAKLIVQKNKSERE